MFTIPADYCLALIDASQYVSFVSEHWTLEDLCQHFVNEMNRCTMLAWGTGASANWQIAISYDLGKSKGFRDFTGCLNVSKGKLYFANYDLLTYAASFEKILLPDSIQEKWCIQLSSGSYIYRLVQLYSPKKADTRAVFNQKTPNFVLELSETQTPTPLNLQSLLWFPKHL